MGERPRHEIAEVFQRYLEAQPARQAGPAWSWEQRSVVDRILACRTARLGGHVDACDACGQRTISYNSCRNRHCPKCQGSAQALWLAARQGEVLPVPYAHVVFTIPQCLAPLALQNPKVVYDLLLRTAARTLQEIAANPRHLGARLGFFTILHTWGQTLVHHPHVHCVVPAGGLADDGRTWKPCRPGFFLPVRVLSRLFRGKLLAELAEAFREGRIELYGRLADYRSSAAFGRLLHEARRTEWVVYAKPPFGSPDQVLAYLGRYTHRVAIANSRLVRLEEGQVSFRWRDYRHHDKLKVMTLAAGEFIRRFLLHTLPDGFHRIRHYGLLANGHRRAKLAHCRQLLDAPPPTPPPPADYRERYRQLTGVSLDTCPCCGGAMLPLGPLPRRARPNKPSWFDSS